MRWMINAQLLIPTVSVLVRCVSCPLPPFPFAQAFVEELINIGELKWLQEWSYSTDKKGLLTKVT